MKRVLVCGGAGFIGQHLIRRLRRDGAYTISVDRNLTAFGPNVADMVHFADLRSQRNLEAIFSQVDEVYQLAAEVGGLGYIHNTNNDAEMLHNSAQINFNVLEVCRRLKISKVFFSSSACVYPSNGGACREEDAYPAYPDNEYAWEKLFSERVYDAYRRNYGMDVKIARFHNCYGPYGTWQGGREKAPAALCRKVAEVEPDGTIEIWGDGQQTRSFMYVDDCVEGAVCMMSSPHAGPLNIGSSQMVTVNQLLACISEVANKRFIVRSVEGPQGVRGRNSDNVLIKEKLGWEPGIPLREGLEKTYRWIEQQVLTARKV